MYVCMYVCSEESSTEDRQIFREYEIEREIFLDSERIVVILIRRQ